MVLRAGQRVVSGRSARRRRPVPQVQARRWSAAGRRRPRRRTSSATLPPTCPAAGRSPAKRPPSRRPGRASRRPASRPGRRPGSTSPRRPCSTPSSSAVAGLISAALSQVSRVIGSGSLLQPAVVGEPAVVDRRRRGEDDFQVVDRRCGSAPAPSGAGRQGRHVAALRPADRRRTRRAATRATPSRKPVVRRGRHGAPDRWSWNELRAICRSPRGPVASRRQQLDGRRPPYSGSISGCDDAVGAVVGPGVAPGFEEVGPRQVPRAAPRGLVCGEAQVDRRRHLGQRRGEIAGRPGRCRPGCRRGSAACATWPAAISATSDGDRLDVRGADRRRARAAVRDRLAHVAQRRVERRRTAARTSAGWPGPTATRPLPAVGHQVWPPPPGGTCPEADSCRVGQALAALAGLASAGERGDQSECRSTRRRGRRLRAAAQRQAMIGRRTGEREAALDGVEPVHLARRRARAVGELAGVSAPRPDASRAGRRRHTITRGPQACRQRWPGYAAAGPRAPRAVGSISARSFGGGNRLVLVPLRRGTPRASRFSRSGRRGRTARLGQHADPAAAAQAARRSRCLGELGRTSPRSVTICSSPAVATHRPRGCGRGRRARGWPPGP